MEKPPVVLIAGPTGVGKTSASVKIAKALDTEIISADSMQIYKYMDIGTAKVTKAEADGIYHHMIDIVSPLENYSVCDYVKKAKQIIDSMHKKGLIPLIVGGTGLYADSLTGNLSFEENASSDESYRKELFETAEEKGADFIHKMLFCVDSESAENIHPNNVKRVIRALEYYHATGVPISVHNRETKNNEPAYDSIKIGFTRSRESLYKRIDKRVDVMLENGLISEVKSLVDMGCTKDHTSMQALGYKEVIDYLSGSIGYDEMTELIKRDSRRYAKRQMTWFKRDDKIHWINLDETDENELVKYCTEFIRAHITRSIK